MQIEMLTNKRVLLTGGGTAGHVNPALAIGSVFSEEGTRFLYVGVRRRAEEEIVPREGIPIKYIRASGFPEGVSLKLASFCLNLLVGMIQSVFILARFRPGVIIGTGGYVSAPVLIAAALLRKLGFCKSRVFIHEQNAVPGKLNRLMGRFAHRVLISFPETLSYFPNTGVLTGYPIRKRISRISREEALKKSDLGIPEGRKVIFVFGGSQGSRAINRALVDALEHLLPFKDSLFVVHGVGFSKSREYDALKDTEAKLHFKYSKEQLKKIESFYRYRAFFHDIELLYALSDLVVARGGAGSLSEISAMGLPALIIPKSNLPGNHQVLNARSMERAGGAEILYEQVAPANGGLSEWIDGKLLAQRLLELIQDDERRQRLRQHSGSFLNRDALSRIERVVRGGQAEQDSDYLAASGGPADRPLPDNASLLALLENFSEKHPPARNVEEVIPDRRDLEYLKNRASTLLIHPSWQKRNLGVKLLGLLHAGDKLPALLSLFNDREPASLLKRLVGGDFEQVGFIRRNVMTALVRINEWAPEVENAILRGFEDPYWEVRAESARAAAFFGSKLSSPKRMISALIRLLRDPNLEVSVAAAEALGKLGGEEDALPELLALWDTRFWKMRAAVLRGINHLVDRDQVKRLDALESQIPRFILTSTDFRPHFDIKFAYRRLMESVSRKKEKRIDP